MGSSQANTELGAMQTTRDTAPRVPEPKSGGTLRNHQSRVSCLLYLASYGGGYDGVAELWGGRPSLPPSVPLGAGGVVYTINTVVYCRIHEMRQGTVHVGTCAGCDVETRPQALRRIKESLLAVAPKRQLQ